MLIELKVKNFLSIREEQTFSLVASPATELEQNVSVVEPSLRLVRAAAIYGANAAGKSNMLSALSLMQLLVKSSATDSQEGDKIPTKRFLFDKATRLEPSEFEVIFIKEKIRYQYGFAVDEERVHAEWLTAYPLRKPQEWFSRVYNQKQKVYEWKFSKLFKGGKQFSDLTRSNVLFLSRAVDLNNEQLKPIFNWFQEDLLTIDASRSREISQRKSLTQIETEQGKQKILSFVQIADPSITDIIQEKTEKARELSFPDDVPLEMREYLKRKIPIMPAPRKIMMKHSGGDIPLDLRWESAGTIRALNLAGFWLEAVEKGRTLIIDELDNSLHPLFTRFLISLICDPQLNKNGAQLIFSTHDTSLLDNELLRRDQIWFVEKDKHNATQLYSLLDFSPRKNEAIEKGYLQGRYGALPYIGEWRF